MTTSPTTASESSSSSIQSLAANDEQSNQPDVPTIQPSTTAQLLTNLLIPNQSVSGRASSSLFAKFTDAKKSLFGRSTTPDPFFSAADENKALRNYILSESNPPLDVIQEYERTGAQLNAITDEGNTAIHLLARAEIHTVECINIIDHFIKKGCDPNRQNDYGWTAGKIFRLNKILNFNIFLF